MRSRITILALITALLSSFLVACGQTTPATPTTAPASNSGSASSAGTAKVGSIEIVDAWTRPAMAMTDTSSDPHATSAMTSTMSMHSEGPTSGSFMLIRNSGAADKLIKVESDVAKSTELHTVEMVDGVMKMRPVEGGIPVPANGEVALKPGSYHVMLIGLHKGLNAGDTVALKLQFEKAGSVTVQTVVKQP